MLLLLRFKSANLRDSVFKSILVDEGGSTCTFEDEGTGIIIEDLFLFFVVSRRCN